MALARKLGSLALPTVKGQRSSPRTGEVSGKTYRFEPNERGVQTLTFYFDGSNTFTLEDAQGEHRIACGSDTWQKGTATLIDGKPHAIAASAAWLDNETYRAQVYLSETPYYCTFTIRFAGDEVLFDLRQNVSFGATEFPQLVWKTVE